MSKEFIRKTKESKPVVAICYDFDKTLSPDDMQAQGYIQSVGDEVESFWKESNGLAEENDMDQNLAYMFTMIQKAHGKVIFNKKALMDYGAKVQLFPGVETWFKRIRDYGMERGVIVEHYIISSGLKEMIEGTKVANEFEKIYALNKELGLPVRIADIGITEEQFFETMDRIPQMSDIRHYPYAVTKEMLMQAYETIEQLSV